MEMLLLQSFDVSEHIGKAVIKQGIGFAFFCNLIALTLG